VPWEGEAILTGIRRARKCCIFPDAYSYERADCLFPIAIELLTLVYVVLVLVNIFGAGDGSRLTVVTGIVKVPPLFALVAELPTACSGGGALSAPRSTRLPPG
jgi:hypothetical protein